jgi:hypothetical protein
MSSTAVFPSSRNPLSRARRDCFYSKAIPLCCRVKTYVDLWRVITAQYSTLHRSYRFLSRCASMYVFTRVVCRVGVGVEVLIAAHPHKSPCHSTYAAFRTRVNSGNSDVRIMPSVEMAASSPRLKRTKSMNVWVDCFQHCKTHAPATSKFDQFNPVQLLFPYS